MPNLQTPHLTAADLKHFQERLESRRAELMASRRGLDRSWRDLHEREAEFEESAQMEHSAQSIDALDSQEASEIEAVDTALHRLHAGSYGVCLECGEEISKARLEAIPWTTMCAECAAERESEPQETRDEPERPNLPPPPDLAGMSDEQMCQAIRDFLMEYAGNVDFQELELSCADGVVTMDGYVPSRQEHAKLLEVLEDWLGMEAVVDNVREDRILWQRPDRAPGREDVPTSDEEIVLEGEGGEDDVMTSIDDGTSYNPPDDFVPEKD